MQATETDWKAKYEELLAAAIVAENYLHHPGCHIEFRGGTRPEYPNALRDIVKKSRECWDCGGTGAVPGGSVGSFSFGVPCKRCDGTGSIK